VSDRLLASICEGAHGSHRISHPLIVSHRTTAMPNDTEIAPAGGLWTLLGLWESLSAWK